MQRQEAERREKKERQIEAQRQREERERRDAEARAEARAQYLRDNPEEVERERLLSVPSRPRVVVSRPDSNFFAEEFWKPHLAITKAALQRARPGMECKDEARGIECLMEPAPANLCPTVVACRYVSYSFEGDGQVSNIHAGYGQAAGAGIHERLVRRYGRGARRSSEVLSQHVEQEEWTFPEAEIAVTHYTGTSMYGVAFDNYSISVRPR